MALLVLWIASAIRVIGAAVRHEVFGTEATLAVMSVVLVPFVIFRSRVRAPEPATRRGPDGRAVLRLVTRDGTASPARASARQHAVRDGS